MHGKQQVIVPQPIESEYLLEVENLSCTIETAEGPIRLVDDVSFAIRQGETLGIVGESGSGKTMVARAIMGISPPGAVIGGRVLLRGVDMLTLPKQERRRLMGSSLGMIFQNPMTSLNPMVTIGRQITEGLRYHQGISRKEATARAIDLLEQVGISEPAARVKQYPFQLSGGMRQRVVIASALASDPVVLIADEATTALDVTVQKQILDLIQRTQAERNMAVIIISHDLGVVADRTDKLSVMYSGQVIESGSTASVFERHRHQYTAALLRAIPDLADGIHTELATIPGTPRRPSADSVGCRFASRCAAATDLCRETDPVREYDEADAGHWYRCFWPTEQELPSGRQPSELEGEGAR